ncbi:MAG: efflux RND transporter periplasmic adaptor subunit, partial [Gammaproteobacteria bacterium]|nr:efflux RND transporter periplasmic adaptor subunit [Gammaproteobacteria bacterium]
MLKRLFGGSARGRLFIVCLATLVLLPIGLPAQAPRGAPVLIAESTTQRIVREVSVAGTVTSPRTASLSTQIGGMVARITVDEGDLVEPGHVLVELDRELAEFEAKATEAERERAEATLADARRRLEEGRELVQDRTIPQSDFEALAAEVAIAEAGAAAADATARRQRAVLERHRIRAPFAGVVSRRAAEVGEWISPGVEVLELVAVDELRLDFRVAQELFAALSRETAVTIQLDAQPGQQFEGR